MIKSLWSHYASFVDLKKTLNEVVSIIKPSHMIWNCPARPIQIEIGIKMCDGLNSEADLGATTRVRPHLRDLRNSLNKTLLEYLTS